LPAIVAGMAFPKGFNVTAPTAQAAQSPESYRTARAAGIRAAVMREPESPRVERALARLDRVLSSDGPPNEQVPRGFYINIEI
jgi:hypothetical protein